MAVRPVAFDSNVLTVWHDEVNHGGVILWSAISYLAHPDGTVDQSVAIILCPVCLAVSTHPITGGCDADGVQRAFTYGLMYADHLTAQQVSAAGLPPNYPTDPPRTWGQAKMLVRAAVLSRNPAAWRLEDIMQGS